MSTSKEDLRKTGLKNGLRQLSLEQLKRVRDYNGEMCLDTYNYSPDGKFCPLAIGLGLDTYIDKPTPENVTKFLIDNGYEVYNTKGVKGDFYTTDRARDLKEALSEVIDEKEKVNILTDVVTQFGKLNLGFDFYLVGSAAKFWMEYNFSDCQDVNSVGFADIDIFCEGTPPVLLDHQLKANSFTGAKYSNKGLKIDIWQDTLSKFLAKSIEYCRINNYNGPYLYNITKDYFLEGYKF